MPIQKLRPTFTFTEDRLKQLEQVVPEAFADGKIDWEALQEALGEELEDGREEHFGLSWPGKREARRKASIPPTGTLVPCPSEGINNETTENIFIEGNNIEVLKTLQKSYAGKIKMIYIDPPYNTGKDFIYNDNFTDTIDAYMKYIEVVDEGGEILSSNTRDDGRFHTRWLNMMYPRLILARQLLRDDGIVFISVDDNEVYHLRATMNEIFGEEAFLGVIKRRAARKTAFLSKTMSDICDYVVIYSKGILTDPLSIEKVSDSTRPVFNEGNRISERVIPSGSIAKCFDGIYESGFYTTKSITFELKSDVIIKDGVSQNAVTIEGPWRVNQDIVDRTIYFTKNFGLRRFVTEEETEKAKAMSDLLDDPDCYNEKGSEMLQELFNTKSIFSYPKPVGLIKLLLDASNIETGDIVLDFFAGSCTTAQAVLEKSVSDEINIRFIMVQIHELLDIGEFTSIAELGKERVRRVINQLKNAHPRSAQDLGFKVYSYYYSNFKSWVSDQSTNPSQALQLFEDHTSPLKDHYRVEDLITEILLLEGFPLTTKLTSLDTITTNIVYEATAPSFCDHKLFICLEETLESFTADQLVLDRHDIFVCLDSALTDELKVRLADRFNVHIV